MNNKDMSTYPVINEPIDENEWAPGLTKLEAFTKAITAGMLANPAFWQVSDPSDDWVRYVTKTARRYAEAALAELEGRG